MEAIATPKRPWKVALIQGLIFGIGLAVISILLSVLNSTVNLGGASIIVTILGFIIECAAFFVAGMRASQQTGKTGTGALAGLWTGLFSSILTAPATLIIFFSGGLDRALNAAHPTASISTDTMRSILIGGIIFGVILSLAIGLGIGAGIGALGGLVGKRRAPVQPETYQQPY